MPVEPTLAIADNGDDTGATATITGGSGTATNEVFVAQWAGTTGSLGPWVSEGSRVGNGTVLLSVSAGYYFGYVRSTESGDTATTPPAYFRASTGDDAILAQCLDAVQTRIQGLVLADILVANIITRFLPVEKGIGSGEVIAFPAIVIAPPPDSSLLMPINDGVNVRDDVQYPVMVGIVDALTTDDDVLTKNKNRNYLWQQQILKAFRNQRLPGVPDVYTTIVEAAQITNDQAFRRGRYLSFAIFRFINREARGLT